MSVEGSGSRGIFEKHEHEREARRKYTPVQAMFLARLQRLVKLAEGPSSLLDDDKGHYVRTICKATYSTLCDCNGLGLTEEARDIIRNTKPNTSNNNARLS